MKRRKCSWEIWIMSWDGCNKWEMVGHYANRGHAVARLRGLRRRSWLAGSEINYSMERGLP